MNAKTVCGILLIVLGIMVLGCSGLTFTTPGKTVDFIGLHLMTTQSHFISPAIGAAAVMAGVVLMALRPWRI